MQTPGTHSRTDGRTGDQPELRLREGGGFLLRLTFKEGLENQSICTCIKAEMSYWPM